MARRWNIVLAAMLLSMCATGARADFNSAIEGFYSLTHSDENIGFGIWKMSAAGNCTAMITHTRGSSDNVERIDFRKVRLQSIASMSSGNPHIGFVFTCRVAGCMRTFDVDRENRLDPTDSDWEVFPIIDKDLPRALAFMTSVGRECGFAIPRVRIF